MQLERCKSSEILAKQLSAFFELRTMGFAKNSINQITKHKKIMPTKITRSRTDLEQEILIKTE